MTEPVAPYLTLVAPAYNCAPHIAANLRAILDALEAIERPFELIVVCDGSTDGTAEAARTVDDPRVRVLRRELNGGKGQAVVHGLLAARGRLVGWLDGDLDIGPEAIVAAVAVFDAEEVDAVLGSKRHPDSTVAYPVLRRLYSLGFQLLARVLFRVGIRDTQVGAKVFRREVVDTVAPLLLIKRYAFDLEFLAVSVQFGFDRLREVPVRLEYRFHGTSIDRRAVWKMLVDTLAIAYRIHLRHSYVRRFAAQHRTRVDAPHQSTRRLDSCASRAGVADRSPGDG